MIPLFKLEKLPRTQRLRKTVKIITETEKFLAAGGVFDAEKQDYFLNIAKMLIKDDKFSPVVQKAFEDAAAAFRTDTSHSPLATPHSLLRTFNTMRHLLLAETGHSPADWDFYDDSGKLDPASRRPFPGMMVYFEDIRSPFNVGSMFRAADAFGVDKVFLSPFCADPQHPRARRSSMGCVDVLSWERCDFGETGFPADCPVFALETGGTSLADFSFPKQGLLIAGSEELGVSPAALAVADSSLGRVTIPCYGAKSSLNVSVAFGIVMQAWAAKRYQATF